MKLIKTVFIFILFFFNLQPFKAQTFGIQKVGTDSASVLPPHGNQVITIFKTTQLINAQTTETLKRKTMYFRITQRFGKVGASFSDGFHKLWGIDKTADLRFSANFGITDKLQLGLGRSKVNELLDGAVKWRLLEQTKNNTVPVSVCIYSSIGVTAKRESMLYPKNVIIPNKGSAAHRINYFSQLIVSRKFNDRFSLELLPAYHYRNFVVEYINTSNDSARETNGLFSLGIGGSIQLNKNITVIADYYYIRSAYRKNNKSDPFENPLAVGLEFENGRNVFQLSLTNATGISENNLIPECRDQWLKGGFKFGFTVSRKINL